MRRRAAPLLAAALCLVLPAVAQAQPVEVEPPVLSPGSVTLSDETAELFWCASTLYWLMTDAYDSGDLAQAQDFEAMAGRFANAATTAATEAGFDLESVGAIGAGYDQQSLEDLSQPASFDRISLCITTDAANQSASSEPAAEAAPAP